MGILNENLPTIDTESQADCASGAFVGSVLHGLAPHFRITSTELDDALNGYLLVRDQTPTATKDISHGNGFDRLSAIDDGIEHGVTYCYSSSYFNRQFTERPFQTDTQNGVTDATRGGNQPVTAVLHPASTTDPQAGLQPNLNSYWTAAARTVNRTFRPVAFVAADHPACGASAASQFDYCPSDNTVYYRPSFADQAYDSLAVLSVSASSAKVSVLTNQPADYALGTLFVIGWGLAVRHQLFGGSTTDQDGLLAAICYAGAYSNSINQDQPASGKLFLLSAPDLDEATSARLNLVGLDQAYGARGTTGLERIQNFVTGYDAGLGSR